jgi:hypothetical protein
MTRVADEVQQQEISLTIMCLTHPRVFMNFQIVFCPEKIKPNLCLTEKSQTSLTLYSMQLKNQNN